MATLEPSRSVISLKSSAVFFWGGGGAQLYTRRQIDSLIHLSSFNIFFVGEGTALSTRK